MTQLDRILVPQAAKLIKRFGRNITYRRLTSDTAFDVDELEVGTETFTESTVKAVTVQLDPKKVEDFDSKEQQAEWQVLISTQTLGFEPNVDDELVFGGITYGPVMIFTHQSGEEAALYEVMVVRSP
jgi:hypothetical protein